MAQVENENVCRYSTCSKEFDSQRGRAVHETKVHGGPPEQDWKDKDYLKKKYLEDGHSIKEIANMNDTTTNRIRQAMEDFSIESRTPAETAYFDRIQNLEDSANDIKEGYVVNKEPIYKIAEKYQVTEERIKTLLKNSGVEIRSIQEQHLANTQYKKLNDESWLREEYREKERYTPSIAEQLGCNPQTVTNALKRHGIEIWEHAKTISGEKHPRWKGGTQLTPCDWCGETYPSRVYQDDDRYCSEGCVFKWRSENLVGENATNWKGGSLDYFGPNWGEKREKCIQEDSESCRICSMDRQVHKKEIGVDLHVHHIIPRRKFVKDGELDYKRANRIDNLATLCNTCHGSWEGIPVIPQ